jgi:hypothetical protein
MILQAIDHQRNTVGERRVTHHYASVTLYRFVSIWIESGPKPFEDPNIGLGRDETGDV